MFCFVFFTFGRFHFAILEKQQLFFAAATSCVLPVVAGIYTIYANKSYECAFKRAKFIQ